MKSRWASCSPAFHFPSGRETDAHRRERSAHRRSDGPEERRMGQACIVQDQNHRRPYNTLLGRHSIPVLVAR
jgi:hypothetical protein